MRIPIRTLSQRDVDILARCSFTSTISKGYVEQHGLRWTSPSLREWELRQRNLKRSRKVEVLIDELDLSEVFVVLPAENGNPQAKLRAISTQPLYTEHLSLYEHEKLKSAIKAEHLKSRLSRLQDSELYRLRTEYYALLGRQKDPIAARRLEKLRDQLAERRHARKVRAAAEDTQATDSLPPDKTPTSPPADTATGALPAPEPQAAPRPTRSQKKPKAADAPATETSKHKTPDPPEPPPTPAESTQPDPPGATPPADTPTATSSQNSPIYSAIRIKRKHR